MLPLAHAWQKNNALLPQLPPDLARVAREPRVGVVERGYQVIGWTRLSPASVFFQTSTPGHVVRVSDGRVRVEVAQDGNVTFSGSVCANDAECASHTQAPLPVGASPPSTPARRRIPRRLSPVSVSECTLAFLSTAPARPLPVLTPH